jgi:RHS repeat-associated protein
MLKSVHCSSEPTFVSTSRLIRSQTGTTLVARTSYTYDGADRLNGMTHRNSTAALTAYDWTYDGHRLNTQTITQTATPTFAYDEAATYFYRDDDQLIRADRGGTADENYDYDPNGNRNTGYLTDLDNRMSTAPAPADVGGGDYTFEYDHEGNITTRTRTTTMVEEVVDYTFDHRNRLTKVVITGGPLAGTTSYTYDAMDRRNGKEVSATNKTRFVYDGEDIALSFIGVTGAHLANRYLHGPGIDEVFADEQGANTYWLLTDHLGTVRDLTDGTGALAKHIAYDSFGRKQGETAAGIQTLYAFTGREYDVETGLQYHRARYYDPQIGRWISQDPIGFDAGDSNLYRYVNNGPTGRTDPSGLQEAGQGCCGLEVGPVLKKGLTLLEEIFNKKSIKGKADICDSLFTVLGSTAAWDITQFYNTGEKDREFFTKGNCGKGKCNRTVTVNGECHIAGAVNYILWGKINKLCNTFISKAVQRRVSDARIELRLEDGTAYPHANRPYSLERTIELIKNIPKC